MQQASKPFAPRGFRLKVETPNGVCASCPTHTDETGLNKGIAQMKCIHKSGKIEIWQIKMSYGYDYLVYGITISGDPVTCPSIGMAFEKAAQ